MGKTWIITKHELQLSFDSLMAYIILVVFLGFSGFFTWLYGSDIFFVNQASLHTFFGIAYWTLFFFIPALTMKSLSEENKSGTIELLLTKPVTQWQVVLGKFWSILLLVIVALALTLPYYITVACLGNIDTGATISGYLGLILMSSAYISIGIFTSSLTNNQIISFLLALFIGVFFHIIFGILASSFTGTTSEVLNYLSTSTHFESISRGVIDTKDLIYFLSITVIGLASAQAILEKKTS